jgi:hypothetical protein
MTMLTRTAHEDGSGIVSAPALGTIGAFPRASGGFAGVVTILTSTRLPREGAPFITPTESDGAKVAPSPDELTAITIA